jgi:hypothetical protein
MALFGGFTEPEPLTVEAAEVALRQAEAALFKPSLLAAMARGDFSLILRHASAELRADKEVVLAAVAQKGDALQYASAELKVDKEVLAARHYWWKS